MNPIDTLDTETRKLLAVGLSTQGVLILAAVGEKATLLRQVLTEQPDRLAGASEAGVELSLSASAPTVMLLKAALYAGGSTHKVRAMASALRSDLDLILQECETDLAKILGLKNRVETILANSFETPAEVHIEADDELVIPTAKLPNGKIVAHVGVAFLTDGSVYVTANDDSSRSGAGVRLLDHHQLVAVLEQELFSALSPSRRLVLALDHVTAEANLPQYEVVPNGVLEAQRGYHRKCYVSLDSKTGTATMTEDCPPELRAHMWVLFGKAEIPLAGV